MPFFAVLSLVILANLFSVVPLPGLWTLHAYTIRKNPPQRVIESFNDEPAEKFPRSFRTYPFRRTEARQVYRVLSQDGNNYLAAFDDQNYSVQIFKEFVWDLNEYPRLSWRWRAKTLPPGGNESGPATNDSACGVYVVFGKYTGTAIKYVWSSTLPPGSVIEKKPGRFFITSKEMGPARLGNWQTVTIDVSQDYQRLFKHPPEHPPTGFGILTDGNAVRKEAACDYDDFVIAQDPGSGPQAE